MLFGQFFQFDHLNSDKDVDLRPRAGSFRTNEKFKETEGLESIPIHKKNIEAETEEIPLRPRSKTIHDFSRAKSKDIVSKFFQFDHVNSGKDVDFRPKAGSFQSNEKFKEMEGCESTPIRKEQNHKQREITLRRCSKTIHDIPQAKPKEIVTQFFHLNHARSGKEEDLRPKTDPSRKHVICKEMKDCESSPIHKRKEPERK